VQKASAEKSGAYKVEPDLGIESVALSADGMSAAVKTKEARNSA